MDRKSNALRILKRFVSCRSASAARVHICFPPQHKHLRVLDLSENCITTTTNLQNNCVCYFDRLQFSHLHICTCVCSILSQDLRELKLYGNEITVIEGLQRWDTLQ